MVMTTEKDAVRFEAAAIDGVPIAAVPLDGRPSSRPRNSRAGFAARLGLARLRHSPPGPSAQRPTRVQPASDRQLFDCRHRTRETSARIPDRPGPDRRGPRAARRASSARWATSSVWRSTRSTARIGESPNAISRRPFPPVRCDERRAIARGAFTHFGRLLLELLKFSTLSLDAMMDRVEFDGEDRARLAYAQGKGVLFFTGHFGYWELHAIAHGLQIEPIGVLARALDNVQLNSVLEGIRQRTGNTVIYRQGTIRRVMRMLHAGHGIALLIDQHIQGRDAIYVDFFERPAATTSALAALALRTGAPVVPVFALPLGAGRYRMIYEHPVEPPRADSDQAIREFTQRCTDVLEMYVRRHPDLWLWMHRRWRDGGPSLDGVPGMFPVAHKDAEEEPDMTRLVIVAPNWLGDAVMALPAIADLRRARPSTTIAVAAKSGRGVVVRHGAGCRRGHRERRRASVGRHRAAAAEFVPLGARRRSAPASPNVGAIELIVADRC